MFSAMLLTTVLLLAASAKPATLPPGKGKAIVQRTCISCHALKVVTAKRASKEQWSALVDQMISRREMPRMAALLRSGARGRMRVEPERLPALVWTTIATGRPPEDDGILPAAERRVPLSPGDDSRLARVAETARDLLSLTRAQPATAVLRGLKPFWSVASEKGFRVGVVNWRATWPADPVNGYVVSDRAFFTLERRGPRDREAPPAAFARLEEAGLKSEPDRARRMDLFALDAADLLRGAHPPELEAIYLPGLDIATRPHPPPIEWPCRSASETLGMSSRRLSPRIQCR